MSFQGVTLLELMIVLTIATFLVAIGAPAWQHFVASNQATASINQLVGAVNLARSEAIRHSAMVTLCHSANHQDCSGHWEDGQMIFIDYQESGVVNSINDILRVFAPLPAGATLHYGGFGSKDYLQISAIGLADQQNGHFIYCPPNKDAHYARAIFISKAGRVRLSQDSDHDGIDEDAQGKPLRCA